MGSPDGKGPSEDSELGASVYTMKVMDRVKHSPKCIPGHLYGVREQYFGFSEHQTHWMGSASSSKCVCLEGQLAKFPYDELPGVFSGRTQILSSKQRDRLSLSEPPPANRGRRVGMGMIPSALPGVQL